MKFFEDAELKLELLIIAQRAARATRELIIARRSEMFVSCGEILFDTKSSDVDPVTRIDREAETFIHEFICRYRPNDGFLGEEFSRIESVSGIDWIIDPIDGTVNFIYDIPAYAVSIAARYQGRIIVGVVIDIVQNILFYASENTGSYRIEYTKSACPRPNVVSTVSTISHSLLGVGFSYREEIRRVQLEIYSQFLPLFRDIRRIGSAALDLVNIACGKIDWYVEYGLQPWDFAAGALIASQAGAQVYCPALDSDFVQPQLVWAGNSQLADEWDNLQSGLLLPTFIQNPSP